MDRIRSVGDGLARPDDLIASLTEARRALLTRVKSVMSQSFVVAVVFDYRRAHEYRMTALQCTSNHDLSEWTSNKCVFTVTC